MSYLLLDRWALLGHVLESHQRFYKLMIFRLYTPKPMNIHSPDTGFVKIYWSDAAGQLG